MSKLHHESVSDVMVEFCMFDSLMWKKQLQGQSLQEELKTVCSQMFLACEPLLHSRIQPEFHS